MTNIIKSSSNNLMCSLEEINFRTKHKLVHPLESLNPTAPQKELVPDRKKMVKEYVRLPANTATCSGNYVRSPTVLKEATLYLLNVFHGLKESQLALSYTFVSNRLRAVRQDLIVSNNWNAEAMLILEQMIPFYLETLHLGLSTIFSSFDLILHLTELQECFSKWFNCSGSTKRNVDIIASFLLYTYHRTSYDRSYFSLLHTLPMSLKSLVQSLLSSNRSCNYVHYFKLLKSISSKTILYSTVYLTEDIRVRATDVISIAYKSKNAQLPKDIVCKWLGYSVSDDFGLSESNLILVSDLKVSISSCWPKSLFNI